MARVIIRAIFV